MAVDRKLLEQELMQGQEITNRAIAGQGFDPRGGWAVAGLQALTAGIGAFAQNRVKKALAEDLQNRTSAFEGKFPQFAGLNLSPETQEAITLKAVESQFKMPEVQSSLGKLGVDYRAGLIDEDTYRAALRKETSFAPQTVVNVGNDLNKTMTKVDEKVLEKSFDAQVSADEIAPTLIRGKELLNKIKTSPALPYIEGAKSMASAASFGKYQPESLANFQELESISKELGARTLQLFGGSDTDKELKVAIETNIQPGKLDQANRNIVDRKLKAIEILKEKPNQQIQWINDNGSILKRNQYGETFNDFWKNYQRTNFSNKSTQGSPSLNQNLKSKYGLE